MHPEAILTEDSQEVSDKTHPNNLHSEDESSNEIVSKRHSIISMNQPTQRQNAAAKNQGSVSIVLAVKKKFVKHCLKVIPYSQLCLNKYHVQLQMVELMTVVSRQPQTL